MKNPIRAIIAMRNVPISIFFINLNEVSACVQRPYRTRAYPELNGDESSIFCVSNQVALSLATTFLPYNLPEPACRPTTTTSFGKTYLSSHETQNTENTDESQTLG